MSHPYIHYGLEMSLYSGKTRAYLRHKGLPFEDRTVRLWTGVRLTRKVGALVLPVLRTPQGEWLQDTASIIDTLEVRHRERPILPATPRQRIAASVIEAWGDEFWLPSAMHYRWNFQENIDALLLPEAGDNMLPGAPRPLKNWLATKVAMTPQSFLPGLGVKPEQVDTIVAWSEALCDALDAHFAHHPYLLGGRPCLGDFGLIGPLYAHLGRDPYPARELIGKRRHLQAWVHRMQHPPQGGESGDFLADDAVPETLAPIFASVFGEFWSLLRGSLERYWERADSVEAGHRIPRLLGPVTVPMAGRPYRQRGRSFLLWKWQRMQSVYNALSPADRQVASAWLERLGAGDAFSQRLPKVRRSAVHIVRED